MKRYSDYMDEITPDELYKGLLKEGMFTEKLPPIFTSESFYEYCKSCSKGARQKWSEKSDWIPYTSIRNNGLPRLLGIPSPFAYERLCQCLASNWPEFQKIFQENTINDPYKVSQTHIRKITGTEMLFEMNYKNWQLDSNPENELRIGARYVVETDISTCFPSIYTHALPWAVYGKKEAKEMMVNKTLKNSWPDKLDKACRDTTNGETHGVLIGPHASNVLSELLLTKIDAELRGEKKNWKFVRYIDDYHCYVQTYSEGKIFLSRLDRILRNYDLQLNYKKTKIMELPQYEKSFWTKTIGLYKELLLNRTYLDYKTVENYLSHIIHCFNENPEDAAIINYGLKVLVNTIHRNGVRVSMNARNYIIGTMEYLSCIYIYLIPLMENFLFEFFSVGVNQIQNFANQIYATEAGVGSAEAKTYAFYYALKYGFTLNSTITFDKIIESNDCVLKLMAYLYFRRENICSYADQLLDQVRAMDQSDREKNWVYVYEVLDESELKEDRWKELKKRKISFLNDEFQIRT